MRKLLSLLTAALLLLSVFSGCTPAQQPADSAQPAPSASPVQPIPSAQSADPAPTQQYDKETDLLIIGGGGAGLSAAVEAADNGVQNILLLEKMATLGGTTFVSQGIIGAWGTTLLKDQNIDLTEKMLYDLLMANADYKLDPVLTGITIGKAGETIEWLQNTVNVPFLPVTTVGYGPYQMMHGVDGAGIGFREPFQQALDARGVEVMLETRGTRLLQDENGVITGACAEAGGQEITIKAKAVVIATGGYAANAELARQLCPLYGDTFGIGHPAATGDGIIMASNAGAALTNTQHLMAVLKDYEIMAEHNGNTNTANVSLFIASAGNILVNSSAQRFVNEKSGGFMTQMLNEPVLDEMHKDAMPYVWAISDEASLAAYEVKRGLDMEFIQADTPEELAAQMKLDPVALKETIERYNQMAENGKDEDFGRATTLQPLTGKLFAVAVVPCPIITYGGIDRNEKAEVLRADKTVLPGLYVAGEAGANSAYMGFTLSNCFTWGRIAGASAAGYIG